MLALLYIMLESAENRGVRPVKWIMHPAIHRELRKNLFADEFAENKGVRRTAKWVRLHRELQIDSRSDDFAFDSTGYPTMIGVPVELRDTNGIQLVSVQS